MADDLDKIARDAERCGVDKWVALRGTGTEEEKACMRGDPVAESSPSFLKILKAARSAFNDAAGAVKDTGIAILGAGVGVVQTTGEPVIMKNERRAAEVNRAYPDGPSGR